MQITLARSLPGSGVVTRTGARAARAMAFSLETWSRLLLDGAGLAPDQRAHELAWVAENMCALHGVRARVRGPVPRSPCVLVANHVSYFDPLIIAGLSPCTAVAKREVSGWPCIGELCRRLGVLFVDRDDRVSGARTLRAALRLLEQGVSVLVFPEGSTTRGDRVLPFKRGIFGAAQLAGVPIVPVALRYDGTHAPWVGNDTFLPHYVRTMAKPYTRVDVEFLSPLSHVRESAATALASEARARIVDALARSGQDASHFDDALELRASA